MVDGDRIVSLNEADKESELAVKQWNASGERK